MLVPHRRGNFGIKENFGILNLIWETILSFNGFENKPFHVSFDADYENAIERYVKGTAKPLDGKTVLADVDLVEIRETHLHCIDF